MVNRRSYLLLALVISLVLPGVALAQHINQPGVDLPPVDVTVTVPIMRTPPGPSNQSWTGAWFAAAMDANVKNNFAATTEVETYSRRATRLLGGGQVSTDFSYGSGRDPVPGRFFARILGGASRIGAETWHPSGQIVAGADVLLSRTGRIGLRWDVGYEFIGGSVPHHANGRVAIGLLFGPHIKI